MAHYASNDKLEKLIEKLAKSSERTSKISLIISLVALLIACISVFYSHRDFVGDNAWQEKQLEELNNIKNELNKIKQNTLNSETENRETKEI